MLPDPLHPAVVHFPIVLAIILPVIAIAALVVITRGRPVRPLWLVVVLFAGAVTASAWASVETGEDQEELVEKVVGDDPIHEHEDAADLFFLLSGISLAIIAAGLLKGRPGEIARWAGCSASIVVLAAVINVGHTGGELVYVHGAGKAYVNGGIEARILLGLDDDQDDDADDDSRD
jgi:uncharacterized membrane protein